jgi:hypothetical protein
LPCFSAQERPDHEGWLKDEANKARGIAIKPEGVDSINVLRNIAPEDCDKECSSYPAKYDAILPECNQPKTKSNFNYSGYDYYKVGKIFQKRWNLCLKFDSVDT